MPLIEHQYWEAFLRGSIRLPDIDWSVDREDEPTSKKSLKTARRRAEALNRLYGTDQARPSHSVWFVKNHIEYLPLVKAMARVIGMERQMGFDRSSRADALDLADLHTTRSDTTCRNFIRYLEVVCRILWVKRESTEVYHQRTPGRLTSTFTLEEIQVSINGGGGQDISIPGLEA